MADPHVLTQTPENINLLQQNKYRFLIRRLPSTNYFCVGAKLPSININTVEQATPFRNIPRPGVKLFYSQTVEIEFIVDENLTNYLELHDWLVGIGFPDTFDQRKDLVEKKAEIRNVRGRGNVWTDATLLINTSHNNRNVEITFEDIFPTSLSGLTFDTRVDTVITPMTAIATFSYSKFSFPDRT